MKSMKLALVATACALTLPMAAQAEGGLSFNIGVVSLYKSNGIDQDNPNGDAIRPAVQGGVDYDFGNGFYVGNWNSTGNFVDAGGGTSANLEIDLYAGYTNELGNGLSYDVGVARYIYPGASPGIDTNEWYASLTYGIATVKYTQGFNNNASPEAARLSFAVDYPLNDKVTLSAGMGFRNDNGPTDFKLGASYDLGSGLSASAMISGAETAKLLTPSTGETRLILGITKSF